MSVLSETLYLQTSISSGLSLPISKEGWELIPSVGAISRSLTIKLEPMTAEVVCFSFAKAPLGGSLLALC